MKFIKLTIFVICFIFTNNLNAQISGIIFRDFNGNGLQGNSAMNIEPGVSGVIVNAYNSSNQVIASYISQTNGNYSIPSTGTYNNVLGSNTGSVANGVNVRLEFVIPTTNTNINGPLSSIDFSSTTGSSYGSSVQFVSGGSTSINFAINNPQDYVGTDTNPYVVTSQYINGTYDNSGSSPTPSIVSFLYNSTGNPSGGLNLYGPDNVPNTKAITAQTGALWGIAYQRSSKTMFSSAVLRRFIGFGSLGIGGIYKTDMTSPTSNSGATPFVDVKTIGIPVGSDVRTASGCDAISTDPYQPSHDIAASELVGKIGIGGIEYDESRNTLWLVNLNDKKLYGIKNINPSVTPTASDVIGGYSITLPSGFPVVNGVLRPWGVKEYRGNIYVGVVADGSGEAYPFPIDNLKGYILKFDPANPSSGFSMVANFSFDYPHPGYGPGNGADLWNDWQTIQEAGISYGSWYTQPIISDLEFDVDGSIIVGVMDRGGMQQGSNNLNDMDCNSTSLYDAIASGDIIRLCKTTSGYVFSGNTGCTTTIPTNVEIILPSSGNVIQEYYWGDHGPEVDNTAFNETAIGALAFYPGSTQVLSTSIDPENYHANGIKTFSNTTGGDINNYNIYQKDAQPFTMAKAIGIGDIEILGELPPIEIGNRVWMDTDNDGVQDADEMGLDNITVKLYKGTTLIATKTTANGGQYYFNTADGVLPNTAYTIRIEAASFPSGKFVTLKDQTTGGIQDWGDNDANLVAGNADISYTTGNPGENNHTLDFGFNALVTCSTSVTATPGTCNTTDNKYTLTGEVTLTNPPLTGTLTIQIVGGDNQTITLPHTSPISILLQDKILMEQAIQLMCQSVV